MISFVIVNYNTKKMTYTTIQSIIQKCKSCSYEIVLVDNNSKDGSKKLFTELSSKIKNLKYIYNNCNSGFGQANNIGVTHSCGDYIYILNSDTILQTENIEKIIDTKFNQYTSVAVLATKVQYEDETLQPNVQNFTSLKTVLLRLLKIGQFVRNNKMLLNFLIYLPVKPNYIKTYLENFKKERYEELIDWASGCSLIIRREVYDKLGGFDEDFFMYTEDEELCYRVHKIGYKIVYTSDILITHFEGKSNRNKSINEFLVKTKVESEFLYFKKHFPNKVVYLKLIYSLIATLAFPFSKKFRIIYKTVRDIKI